jgi:hypothetical protein
VGYQENRYGAAAAEQGEEGKEQECGEPEGRGELELREAGQREWEGREELGERRHEAGGAGGWQQVRRGGA